jgi:Tetratricopeptide repeat
MSLAPVVWQIFFDTRGIGNPLNHYDRGDFLMARALFLSFLISLAIATGSGSPALAQGAPTKTQAISLYNLGLTAYHQGSPESAIIFFKRAADIDPDLADAQYNLGVLYQSEKRLKEAVPRFQEVLRVKPTDADAHYQLGVAYLDLGQFQLAKDNLSSIAPNSSHFADAQKKMQIVDQKMQGGGLATATPPTQPVDNTPQTQAYVAPAQVTQPVQQPLSVVSPPPAPSAPATPQALLPNATVRVIATNFSAPAGLAFDKQGTLYIANFLSNTIDRISADGTRSQFSSGINLKGPIGLAVDETNNVYVANYLGGYITKINPAGISSIIANGFKKPYYLTLDRDGSLFCSQQEDNSIVRITLPKAIAQPNATRTEATR